MDVETTILLLRVGLIVLLYVFLGQVLIVIWRDLRGASPGQARPLAADEPIARLVLLEGAASGLSAGTEFPLSANNTLGRAAPNTVILPDPAVSARHGRLAYRQGQWWLEDLGSANGTYLNGALVEKPAPVADGDEIEVAQVKLRMEIV